MDRAKGKFAVVTGGASGIGEASARLLAAEGARVAIADIDDKNGARVVREINAGGGTAQFWHMNVTEEKEVAQTMAGVYKLFGKINVLVNSAGIPGYRKPTHEISLEEWNRVIDTNLKGTFLCVKHAIPYMLKTGPGSVINLSSLLGMVGGGDPVYHASKGGVRLMTKSDASTYAKDQIRFNSVHPGYIMTPMFGRAREKDPVAAEKLFTELKNRIPLGRMGTAEDVAKGILFLASDDSSYITSMELLIDGGCAFNPK